MLYKILVLSVGLLGSTAISSSFAGKNGIEAPEKGRVGRRVAALNNIADQSKPQAGKPQAQPVLKRPTPPITTRSPQNQQTRVIESPKQPIKGIQPQVVARADQKRLLPTSPVKAPSPQPTFQTRQQLTPPKPGPVVNPRQLKGAETEQNLLRRVLPTPPVKAPSPQPTFQTRQQFTPPKPGPVVNPRQLKGAETEQNLLRRVLPTPPVKAPSPQPTFQTRQQFTPPKPGQAVNPRQQKGGETGQNLLRRVLPTPPVKAPSPQPTFQTRQQFTPPKPGQVVNPRQLKGGETEQNLSRRVLPTPPVKASSPQPTTSPNRQNLPTQTRQVGNLRQQQGEGKGQNIPLRGALPIPPKSPPTKGTTASPWQPLQAAPALDKRNVGKPFLKLNVRADQNKPQNEGLHKLTARQEPTFSTTNGLRFNSRNFVEDSYQGRKFFFLKTPKRLEGWSQETETLNLDGREFERPPTGLKQFKNLGVLSLDSNKITSLSAEMLGELKDLQVLFIANNKLSSIAKQISGLQELRALKLSQNVLTQIPNEISSLKNLEWLLLDNNKLTHLPAEIGNLDQLQILTLSHNRLVDLPASFKNLTALKGLRLENNPDLRNISVALSGLKNLTLLSVDSSVTLPYSILKREKEGLLKVLRL